MYVYENLHNMSVYIDDTCKGAMHAIHVRVIHSMLMHLSRVQHCVFSLYAFPGQVQYLHWYFH